MKFWNAFNLHIIFFVKNGCFLTIGDNLSIKCWIISHRNKKAYVMVGKKPDNINWMQIMWNTMAFFGDLSQVYTKYISAGNTMYFAMRYHVPATYVLYIGTTDKYASFFPALPIKKIVQNKIEYNVTVTGTKNEHNWNLNCVTEISSHHRKTTRTMEFLFFYLISWILSSISFFAHAYNISYAFYCFFMMPTAAPNDCFAKNLNKQSLNCAHALFHFWNFFMFHYDGWWIKKELI